MTGSYSYILTFIEGILTFVSPCILPLIPVYVFYLAGMTGEEEITGEIEKNRLVVNSIGFVIGFTLVFVILGAAATTLGHFLKSHIDILKKIGAVIIILFGLHFLGVLKLKFLDVEKRMEYKFRKLKFLNSVIFGMVFGFSWTPCLGPFLGTALITAGNSDTLGRGILLLLVYSAGLGVPFIVTSIIFEQIRSSLGRIQKYSRIIGIISGIVLIIMGLSLFLS